MDVHCSYCENVVSVDVSDLQPIVMDTDRTPLDGLVGDDETTPPSNVTTGGGIPYKFEDIVACIKEQLPQWEVDTEDDEFGVETLKLTCEKHLADKHLDELVKEHKKETSIDGEELSEFLLIVGSHLRTLAQTSKGGNFYTLELANRIDNWHAIVKKAQRLASQGPL
jgi:hypothetical protein